MDPQILTFVFLMIGFVLLIAEFFLPSGGIIGAMCAASFLASTYFAYLAWATSAPGYWYAYLTVMIILIPVLFVAFYYLITSTSFGNRVLLNAPSEDEVTPYREQRDHLSSLIGRRGKALNLMMPGGLVEVNGERLHAISQNMMIEANSPIEVVEIQGNRVVVRIVQEDSAPQDEGSPDDEPANSKFESADSQELAKSDSGRRNVDDEIIDPFLPDEEDDS